MRTTGIVLVILTAFLNGAVAADEFEGRLSINSIQEVSGETPAGKDTETLKISTSQSSPKFKATTYVSVEITDKKEKKVYYGKAKASGPAYKISSSGREPSGGVSWEFTFDSSDMQRPKFTGYSVEVRYEEDGQNILLDEEYEDCDTAKELAERNKESLKLTLKGNAKRQSSGGD